MAHQEIRYGTWTVIAITSRYYLLALSLGRYNVYNVPKQPKKAIMKVADCRYRLVFKIF